MPEEMRERIVFALLGWFLGLFSSIIMDTNRRQRAAQELKLALNTELHELQFRMVVLKFRIDKKYSIVNRNTLEWASSILRDYKGINPSESITKFISSLLEKDEKEIFILLQNLDPENEEAAVMLKKFPTSLLETNLPNLPYINDISRTLLSELRFRLNLLNELVEESRFYYNFTFQDTSGENHQRLRENLTNCYKEYSNQCKIIADLIGKLDL